jgi:hypothetical protein
MTRNEESRPARRPRQSHPVPSPSRDRARAKRPAKRDRYLADPLAAVCVYAGCLGIAALVVADFVHPSALGLTALGAIAAAAFTAASGLHGGRGGR